MKAIDVRPLEFSRPLPLSELETNCFTIILVRSFEFYSALSNQKQTFKEPCFISVPSQFQQPHVTLSKLQQALLIECPQKAIEDLLISIAEAHRLMNSFKIHEINTAEWSDLQVCFSLFSQPTVKRSSFKTQSLLLRFIISLMMEKISVSSEFPSSTSYSRRLLASEFKHLVQKHINEKIAVSEFASRLFLSYPKLYSICVEYFGESPKSIVTEEKIIAIKKQLITSNKPLYQIAEEFGYDDASNFSKFFIKHTQIHPSEFRRQADWIIEF